MNNLITKVLCIGDSLALPGHLNSYESTWFYKLKRDFPEYDFTSFFKRQLTTDVLVTMGGGNDDVDNWPKGADCLEAFMPEIVIIQLGIVDCAPRLLNKYERKLVEILPAKIRPLLIRIIKNVKKRSVDNTIVPFSKFKINLNNFLLRAEKISDKVIFIPISIPDHTFNSKNPDAIVNIRKYNEYYFKLEKENNKVVCLKVLDSKEFKGPVYQDGYHPNQTGHNHIFLELKRIFCDIN